MDDLFPLLMVLIFIIAPIIEGLKRKNRSQQPPPPPPPPRQQQRVPPPRSAAPPQEENAAGMVPDELWEILTGQKRSPAPTAPPAPAPVPVPRAEKKPHWDVVYEPELEEDEEAETRGFTLEDVNVDPRRMRGEAQSLETIGRHPEPVVISLEENIPTAAARHAAFHQKIAEPVPMVVRPAVRKALFDRTNRSELQRAFLLIEVFGKPKGLE